MKKRPLGLPWLAGGDELWEAWVGEVGGQGVWTPNKCLQAQPAPGVVNTTQFDPGWTTTQTRPSKYHLPLSSWNKHVFHLDAGQSSQVRTRVPTQAWPWGFVRHV